MLASEIAFIDTASDREHLQLVLKIHERLLDTLDYTKVDSLQSDRIALNLFLLKKIEEIILEMKAVESPEEQMSLSVSVLDEVVGFGPVEPLLRDESITDIFINGPNSIYVERSGRVDRIPIHFLNNEHIFRLVQRVASKSGRHLDLSTPFFDAQLPDGSRIHAIIPPLAIDGIKVSLRKHSYKKFNVSSLVKHGSLTEVMSQFLYLSVQARLNIAICGGTGSGKTTLMNCLLTAISPGERMVTIEDTPELEPAHHHSVRLLTRLANPEGKGAVTQADLMINALRMRPDRVILGELRGAEAFNLLHAMNTGQDGTMVTLHASGTEEVVSRLLNMILMARYSLSAESVRKQIAGALDLIVYVNRLVDGSRRIMTIAQVSEDDVNDIKIEDLFNFNIKKITSEMLEGEFIQNEFKPTKRILSKLVTAGILDKYMALLGISDIKI